MKRILRYCWLPLLLIAAAFGISFLPRLKAPRRALKTELDAIDAEEEAEMLEAELGRDKALAAIETNHREAVDALTEKQKKQAEKLRADPRALSRFLVFAGAKQRKS